MEPLTRFNSIESRIVTHRQCLRRRPDAEYSARKTTTTFSLFIASHKRPLIDLLLAVYVAAAPLYTTVVVGLT